MRSLQAAVQFGDTTVTGRPGDLSGAVQGARAPLAARYATALGATDADALATVSQNFQAMGDRLAAAEAAAHAVLVARACTTRTSPKPSRCRAALSKATSTEPATGWV